MDLEAARAFVTTVERKSITAAATHLGMSRPTLSRQLAAFEKQLGLALLHRSTRSVHPTPAGRMLFEKLRPIYEVEATIEAELELERDHVTGCLRLSVPPALASETVGLLLQLQASHPDLTIDLRADISRIDLRTDAVDLALRAGKLADPNLVQRLLARRDISAYASPAYLQTHGTPECAADLQHHNLLRIPGPDGSARAHWPLRDGGSTPVDGSFVCDDLIALRTAALLGAGITLLDRSTATSIPGLVRVLPALIGIELELHAVFVRRTLQPARVRAFLAAAVPWFAGR